MIRPQFLQTRSRTVPYRLALGGALKWNLSFYLGATVTSVGHLRGFDYFWSDVTSWFLFNGFCSADSPWRQPAAWWFSLPHLKQWLHHGVAFAAHVWHFTDWGLESCLQRPVHLRLVSESCWEFSLGLLFNSVFNASISALSSCNSALAFCWPSSSFWQVFSLEIHKVALHLDQSELHMLASP